MTGDDLSILDLVCLLVAIPVTIIYKLAKNEVPFQDGEVTSSLISASSFGAVRQLCTVSPVALSSSPTALFSNSEALTNVPMALAENKEYLVNQLNTNSVYDKLAFSGNVMAFGGAILISIVNPLKLKYDENGLLDSVVTR